MPEEIELPNEADPRRFYELDSLRGVAALTVVFHHFARICPERLTHLLIRTPLRLLIAGHQAVILFFLLSGFVLTLPYKKKNSLSYGLFLLKRVCRIYLPYLGALALAILCDLSFPGHGLSNNYWINYTWSQPVTARLTLQHILFLGNYNWFQLNPAFWSLVYEMRISLIFPFIAVAVLRLRSIWLILCAVALSLAFFPAALLFSNVLHLSSLDAAINTTRTVHYAAFFIIGSLLAKHLHTVNRWYARLKPVHAAILALVALALYGFSEASSLVQRLSIPEDLFDWPVAAGAVMLIILAMNSRPFHKFLTSRTIHYLGERSYSLYLIHGTILFSLIHTLMGRVRLDVLFLLYLAITLSVTEIFYRFIEHPAMLFGRRLTANRKALPQPTPLPVASVPLA
ncbi:acyltransferase family protein [Tunturiibacter lichenicola]|uniref:acyltransferase family protein n=1 Tax=Tunturiibacter lichenicola TaxID=2051959 RepID=UPI0021B19B29|nr:acyltransferase [Edaphobacter lichenicola]